MSEQNDPIASLEDILTPETTSLLDLFESLTPIIEATSQYRGRLEQLGVRGESLDVMTSQFHGFMMTLCARDGVAKMEDS